MGRTRQNSIVVADIIAGRSAGSWLFHPAWRTSSARARVLTEKLIASFPSHSVPEVARLGRTLRAWRTQVVGYFGRDGPSTVGSEVINVHLEAGQLAGGNRNLTTTAPG